MTDNNSNQGDPTDASINRPHGDGESPQQAPLSNDERFKAALNELSSISQDTNVHMDHRLNALGKILTYTRPQDML